KVNQLQLDFSKADMFGLGLDLRILGGKAIGQANLDTTNHALDGSFQATNVQLQQLGNVLSVPLNGIISDANIKVNGDPDRLRTLSGRIYVDGTNISYEKYRADKLRVRIDMQRGELQLSDISLDSGPDHVGIVGKLSLPETTEDFVNRVSGDIALAANITDLTSYISGVNGNILTKGILGLRDGIATTMLSGNLNHIAMSSPLPPATISDVRFDLLAAMKFPPATDLWSSIAAVIQADVADTKYQDAHIASIQVTGDSLRDDLVDLQAALRSGQSNISITGNARLPKPGTPLDLESISAHAKLHVVTLTDFIQQDLVKGQLTMDGDLLFSKLRPSGFVRALGEGLAYRGLNVNQIDVNAHFNNDVLELQSCRIGFVQNNYLNISGTAQVIDPFSYQGKGIIALPNLDLFNPFLHNFGSNLQIAGSLAGSFSGHGDFRNMGPEARLNLSGSNLATGGVLVQDLALEATVKDRKVNVQPLRISFNQDNFVVLKAEGSLEGTLPFSAQGQVNLMNLGAFDSLLKFYGQPAGLTGNITANFSAAGDSKLAQSNANFEAEGNDIGYRGLSIKAFHLAGGIKDQKGRLTQALIVFDDRNQAELEGTAGLAYPNSYNINAHLGLADLGIFEGLLKSFGQESGLAGSLSGSFSAEGQNKSTISKGSVTVAAQQIRFKGLPVQSANLDATVKDNRAKVQTFRIQFNPQNYIDATAAGTLADPFPYQLNGKIIFGDLGVFKAFTKNLGQGDQFSGSLSVNFVVSSSSKDVLPTAQIDGSGNQIDFRGLPIQKFDLAASIVNQKARISNLHISFDPSNYIEIAGDAGLT
ncbi:MAG: hypothetical protein JO076_09690, partial [Verrucomicrobia bacterium]|nr:hypothetical protein [Verrucomicrobiota bacterium]